MNNAAVVEPLGATATVDPTAWAAALAVSAYRPGNVDTAMQAWIRGRDPIVIGAELHARFHHSHTAGALLTADASARIRLSRLAGGDTGQIWDVTDPDPVPADANSEQRTA